MSTEITPAVKLYADFTLSPIPYWVVITSTYDEDEIHYQHNGDTPFDGEVDGCGNYNLEVCVCECEENEPYVNPIVHIVDLGSLTDSGNTGLNVVVTTDGETRGSGQVKIANAEQGTRPVDLSDLNI